MDNELLLYDRIEIIKTTNEKYDLEHNAYLSFSGGKDSTILHYLLDMALPNNEIPRVFIDTGSNTLKLENSCSKWLKTIKELKLLSHLNRLSKHWNKSAILLRVKSIV